MFGATDMVEQSLPKLGASSGVIPSFALGLLVCIVSLVETRVVDPPGKRFVLPLAYSFIPSTF